LGKKRLRERGKKTGFKKQLQTKFKGMEAPLKRTSLTSTGFKVLKKENKERKSPSLKKK